MIDASTLYRRACDEFDARVQAIRPDQWDAPTPCSDWTVRDLVNHVTVEELWVPPLPGLLLSLVGSTALGVTLLRARFRPRTAAWLLVLAIPLWLVGGFVLGHNSFGVAPIVIAWAMAARGAEGRRRHGGEPPAGARDFATEMVDRTGHNRMIRAHKSHYAWRSAGGRAIVPTPPPTAA
jgi:hypothetical protein